MDSDLTLPATVATELGVEAGDPRLPRLIAAASSAILGATRRSRVHYDAARVEKCPGHGRPRLVLELTPVLSVGSVVMPDGSALSVGDYSLEEPEAGFLYRAGGWPFTGAARAGLPPASDPAVGSEAATITVTYAGGWVTPAQAMKNGWAGPARSLPYDLEEACVQLCTNLYRSGGQAQNVASESLGDYSVSYADRARVGALTQSIQDLLTRYVRPLG